jgi:trehalose 6-phosphate phosphatase
MMMQIPQTLEPNWALFLDVDGTLIEFVKRPDEAHVPQELRQTLEALFHALGGAVALVSGRTIADLDRLFAPLHLPASGQHGAEVRRSDRVRVFASISSPELAVKLAPVYAFAAEHPAIFIENKGLSLAVHYRGAEETRDTLHAMLNRVVKESGDKVQLIRSHLAFDLRPRGVNKGSALDWFMANSPFAGRVPIFIGDDRTDEDGFGAAIVRGGHAIKIGSAGDSAAPWRMAAPHDLRQWLARSATALEQ